MWKDKWPYLLVVLLAIAFIFWFTACRGPASQISLNSPTVQTEQNVPTEQTEPEKTATQEKTPRQPEAIVVDVEGAVKHPGVYEMKQGDRVVDVVKKAGGLTKEADPAQINLAKKLTDEMQIYIPKEGESGRGMATTDTGGTAEGGKININTATVDELQTIPGIGPAKASAIIEYREKNGPFKKVEDLDNVSGIGEKTLEHIKDKITTD